MKNENSTDNEALRHKFSCLVHERAGEIYRNREAYGRQASVISDYFGTVSYEFSDRFDITEQSAAQFAESNISDPYICEQVTKHLQETIRMAREELRNEKPQL